MISNVVPSGSFAISRKNNGILEAYLGTCVGVTLKDTKANLGGLIHILLAEPTGTDTPFAAETYATTGLPVFIKSICEAGASRKNLVAAVAGGALIGEVTEVDLWLDIGGNIAERVNDILQEEDIPVEQSETGGMFSCKMTLDTGELETKIEPLIPVPAHDPENTREVNPDEIASATSSLKPIPQIALKVIRMIRNGDHEIDDLAAEIRQDQVISAKILKLANSVIMGIDAPIDSIERAVIVLGEKKLLQLVISAATEMLFTRSNPGGYSLCKGGLFHHALATAMTAHEISVFTGHGQPDIAYTAGLLHDIGKAALDQLMADAASFFYRSLHNDGMDLCTAEKAKFGMSHTEVGGALATKWQLPGSLVRTIQYHHSPELAPGDRDLITIVNLADLLMSKFKVGYQVGGPNTEQLEQRLAQLGLGKTDFPAIIDRIPRTIFRSIMAI
jgi:putative nucleotidyltransferase with HDIG domain